MALTAEEQANLRIGVRKNLRWRLAGVGAFAMVVVAAQQVYDNRPDGGVTAASVLIPVAIFVVVFGAAFTFLYFLQRNRVDSLPLVAGADRDLRRRVNAALRVGHGDDRVVNTLIREQRDYILPRRRQQLILAPLMIVICGGVLFVWHSTEQRIVFAAMVILLVIAWAMAGRRMRQLRRYKPAA